MKVNTLKEDVQRVACEVEGFLMRALWKSFAGQTTKWTRNYISMMMNSELIGYRIDWLKKFMLPVLFMDCWSLYILDTEEKVVMVLDPTETDPTDEMKRKNEALARKFQFRFCDLFNDIFGAELVETTSWTFVYLLVVQHEPCMREDSGVCRALHPGVHWSLPLFDAYPSVA